MLKRLGRSPFIQKFIGTLLGNYIKLVRRTSRLVTYPDDFYGQMIAEAPVILTMWHGQHILAPISRPKELDISVMISRSADGEINAVAVTKMGLGLIRASGAQKKHQTRKRGGMQGFREALRTLEGGGGVALTADVPKGPSRVSGAGVIQLAKHSGRPIMPIAVATSRHLDLNTWDKASINFPFGTIGMAAGELMHVPRDADGKTVERLRNQLTESLQSTTARAYALAKGGK